MFSVPMYTTPGIDWDTHWYIYIGTLCIFIRLSVCICRSDNINKHRPRIIKFVHSLSSENQNLSLLKYLSLHLYINVVRDNYVVNL